MKTTLKSRSYQALLLEMWQLQTKGWEVCKQPYKNFWGYWVCKLKKDEKRGL